MLRNSRGRSVRPKSSGQKRYVDAIGDNVITFGIGPAGTGKSWLAVAMAVQALQAKQVERIILTRPAVEAGEKLGFLPGDLMAKIDPYLRPLYDALYDMVGTEGAPKLLERGLVEVAPLAFMRGRTLNRSFIILDEAQNTTPEQMKMFLTRIGFGSKAVITGDTTQVDVPGGRSGLDGLEELLGDIEGLGFVRLGSRDVVRHKIVADIVDAYARAEARRGGPGPFGVAVSLGRGRVARPGTAAGAAHRRVAGVRRRRGTEAGSRRARRRGDPGRRADWRRRRLQRLARQVLAAEGVRGPAELGLGFVSEADMAELNREWMGQDGPTDVLAWPLDADVDADAEGDGPAADGGVPMLLGDVVVCPAVAGPSGRGRGPRRRRRAGAAGRPRRPPRAGPRPRRPRGGGGHAGAGGGAPDPPPRSELDASVMERRARAQPPRDGRGRSTGP